MKKYLIKHKDLNKLLSKLDEFKNTFEKFVLKHKNYSYETNISLNNDDVWECKIEVKDESNNFEVLKGLSESSRVL